MDAIATVLLVLVVVYVAYGAYAIVVVHRKTRWLDAARIEPATVEELYAELPVLRDAVARLAPLGFVPCAAVRCDQEPTQPRTIALRRPDDAATAGAAVFRSPKGDPVVVLEIAQHDATGRLVSVQDAPVPALMSLACIRVWRFPGASASEMWTAFARIRAADPAHAMWSRMADGEEVEIVKHETRRQIAELTERGMLVPAADGPRRLTWRGAVLFTLKLLWPWKAMVDRAQVAQARRAARLS